MGRELRRVPMDFEWPLHKVWKGYVEPEEFRFPECPDCGGECYGPEARAVARTFYPHQIGGPNADELAWVDKLGQAEVDNLVERGRLTHLTSVWDQENGWVPKDPPYRPTAQEVNAANRPGARGLDGHDAINRGILIQFRCERLGIEVECPTCQGHGHIATDEQRAKAEEWEWTEPPVGDGYQLWETTSEGSPISPVFATLDELCKHAAVHCSTFGDSHVSAAKWREMLDEDFVRDEQVMPDGTHVVFL